MTDVEACMTEVEYQKTAQASHVEKSIIDELKKIDVGISTISTSINWGQIVAHIAQHSLEPYQKDFLAKCELTIDASAPISLSWDTNLRNFFSLEDRDPRDRDLLMCFLSSLASASDIKSFFSKAENLNELPWIRYFIFVPSGPEGKMEVRALHSRFWRLSSASQTDGIPDYGLNFNVTDRALREMEPLGWSYGDTVRFASTRNRFVITELALLWRSSKSAPPIWHLEISFQGFYTWLIGFPERYRNSMRRILRRAIFDWFYPTQEERKQQGVDISKSLDLFLSNSIRDVFVLSEENFAVFCSDSGELKSKSHILSLKKDIERLWKSIAESSIRYEIEQITKSNKGELSEEDGHEIEKAATDFFPKFRPSLKFRSTDNLLETVINNRLEECLELHYQPIVDFTRCVLPPFDHPGFLPGPRVAGFEVLSRLRIPNSKGDYFSTPDFLDAIKSAQRDIQLHVALCKAVARDAGKLVEFAISRKFPGYKRGEGLYLSLNISPRIAHEKETWTELGKLCKELTEILKDSVKTDQPRLKLNLRIEIIEDGEVSQEVIRMTNASVQDLTIDGSISEVWLDDFGTNQANLANLIGLRVDGIKIDKQFTDNLFGSRDSNKAFSLFKTLRFLAESMGVQTVVEGVDTVMKKEKLLELGFHNLQGFETTHLSKGMPMSDLLVWLRHYGVEKRDKMVLTRRTALRPR